MTDFPTHPTSEKAWRLKFLDALRLHGIVAKAALAAGIHRDTAYFERSQDPLFAEQWAEALDRGVDMLEDVAKQRAYEGSDTLLIFLLKAHRPEKYRERSEVKHTFEPIDWDAVPSDIRDAFIEGRIKIDDVLRSVRTN
jgi:hypothetical protein